jgi:hypothetical protein
MRENRPSGSEGGGAGTQTGPSYPYPDTGPPGLHPSLDPFAAIGPPAGPCPNEYPPGRAAML